MESLGATLKTRKARKSGATYSIVEEWHLMIVGEVDEYTILATPDDWGLPSHQDAYYDEATSSYTSLKPTDYDVAVDDDSHPVGTANTPAIVKATITYTSNASGGGEGSATMPWDRPPEVDTVGGVDVMEAAYEDDDGVPCTNSAGELYDPLPERAVDGAIIRMSYNLQSNPNMDVIACAKKVSSDAFHGVPGAQCYMNAASSKRAVETIGGIEVVYYQVSLEIFVRADTDWVYMPVDNGARIIDGGGSLVAYKDADGNTASGPVLLDGAGNKLGEGDAPVIYPEDGLKIIRRTSWAALDIPNPFTV